MTREEFEQTINGMRDELSRLSTALGGIQEQIATLNEPQPNGDTDPQPNDNEDYFAELFGGDE